MRWGRGMTDQTARPPAQGHVHRQRVRIVCDLDPDEFERIRDADIPGCPRGVMAPKIRTLIEWGLEALEDSRMNEDHSNHGEGNA